MTKAHAQSKLLFPPIPVFTVEVINRTGQAASVATRRMSSVVVSLLMGIVISTSCFSSGQEVDSLTQNNNIRRNPESGLVDEVIKPGTSYTPSTGKLLRVFELNDKVLMGVFISHEDQVIHFLSTCSGFLHVYRNDGSNIVEHRFVSKKGGVHLAEIKGHSFVYGHGKTYTVKNRRSKREAEELFNSRRKRSDSSDDEEVGKAVDELRADQNARLLQQLAFALGEFGIAGSNSPCALFLYTVARSVTDILPTNRTDEDARSDEEPEEGFGRSSVPRGRRSWWATPSCKEYPNRNQECLGMCGYGCNCWEFVCDNCCYNQGCYEHDICCIDFWTMDCLFAFSISCSRYPPYPGCQSRQS